MPCQQPRHQPHSIYQGSQGIEPAWLDSVPSPRPGAFSIHPWLTRAGLIGLSAIVVTYICWYIVVYAVFIADDAYIHMRIARHLTEHGQPFFNLGEPVAASSSPLWLLLLSSLFAIAGPSPLLVPPLNATLSITLFAVLVGVCSVQEHRITAIGCAALCVIFGALHAAAIQMETTLALTLWGLSLLGLQRQRYGLTGLAAGLAACTRYELVLWLPLAALLAPGTTTRVRLITGALAPLGALALFNLGYFGSLLPNTIRAKSIIYTLSVEESLVTGGFVFGTDVFLITITLGGVIALMLIRDTRTRIVGTALFFGIALLGLYAARRVLVFSWYQPLYLVPIMLGLGAALTSGKRGQAALAALAAVLFLWQPVRDAGAEAAGLATGQALAFREAKQGLRVHRYIQIGEELYRNYPDAVLMSSEVGGLGWGFKGRIADAAGLISPEFLRYHPLSVPEARSSGLTGAIPPQAVREARPDLLVSMETFSEAVRSDMAAGRLSSYRLLRREPVLDDRLIPGTSDLRLWNSRYTEIYVHERLVQPPAKNVAPDLSPAAGLNRPTRRYQFGR